MSSRRPVLLMGALLVLLFVYLFMPHGNGPADPLRSLWHRHAPVLSGKNSVSGLTVTRSASGLWRMRFTYFYTGRPEHAVLLSELTPPLALSGTGATGAMPQLISKALPGRHHLDTVVPYPFGQTQTARVTVQMRAGNVTAAQQSVTQSIRWPSYQAWMSDKQFAEDSPAQNLKRAITLINSANRAQLTEAKGILDKLLDANPKLYPAYIQLARVAMKLNWGPEGLHQAHDLLASALQVRPDGVNAKILLGYVYAHERHFRRASRLFRDAAAANPPNLWLWSNWGEMEQMRHRNAAAIREYRLAITHRIARGTHTRARAFAYQHLIALLEQRNDLNGAGALYRQEIADFGAGSCYGLSYARFQLWRRGNSARAIQLAKQAQTANCNATAAREILGLAAYMNWANAHGPQRNALLDRARILLPVDPLTLFMLAMSKWTQPAARQLVAAGEKIDQKDNYNLDALALALVAHKLAAVRRLMALGASPTVPVAAVQIPVALLPVLRGDVAGVRLMRRLGVNYAKISFRGHTAADIAERMNNTALLRALGPRGTAL